MSETITVIENLHYIVAVLATLGAGYVYHQKLREDLINQKIDMLDKFNREHADNCLAGLKEINTKLDKLSGELAEHNAEYSVLRVEVDNVKEQVGKLSAWFSAVIDKK